MPQRHPRPDHPHQVRNKMTIGSNVNTAIVTHENMSKGPQIAILSVSAVAVSSFAGWLSYTMLYSTKYASCTGGPLPTLATQQMCYNNSHLPSLLFSITLSLLILSLFNNLAHYWFYGPYEHTAILPVVTTESDEDDDSGPQATSLPWHVGLTVWLLVIAVFALVVCMF